MARPPADKHMLTGARERSCTFRDSETGLWLGPLVKNRRPRFQISGRFILRGPSMCWGEDSANSSEQQLQLRTVRPSPIRSSGCLGSAERFPQLLDKAKLIFMSHQTHYTKEMKKQPGAPPGCGREGANYWARRGEAKRGHAESALSLR